MAEKEQEEGKTTYLVVFERGNRQKITVPASWKVTFGPVVGGKSRSMPGGPKMPTALRFYESETKQRAVFTDVVSFRDLSIDVLEEKVETKTKVGSLNLDGARKNVTINAQSTEWINPDQPSDTTPLLDSFETDLQED